MSVAVRAGPAATRTSVFRLARTADGVAVALLGALFVVIVALTWRRWGNPEIDAGAELTAADLVAHGAVPYDDVRYFYGPLGLYELAGAFRIFGTSFAVAFGFGLAQAAAILGVFFVLARQWLRPPAAALATAVLLAIGFSGTAFNFVLPHTNSATMGLLFLLLELLAMSRQRTWLAGVAAGFVGLTRPEFAAVAAGAAVAYVVGTWRVEGRRAAGRAGLGLVVPALLIPGAVLGGFAVAVGAGRLFTENLWPVDFIRKAGFRSQSDWMPFTLASLAGLVGRGLVYGALLAGLMASVLRWRSVPAGAHRGRLAALAPVSAAIVGLAAVDAGLRWLGAFGAQRSAIEHECRHLVLGMSWLPFLAAAAACWSVVRLVRGRKPPFSASWAADLALVAVAAALGLRAYNAFTAEGSYAPYYAAPLVLLAGILHERVGGRWPGARTAALASLGAVAAGLAIYALVGLYADNTTPVHTARGTFLTEARSAPAIQAAVDLVDSSTNRDDAVLAAPSDGGLYFMTGRTPALSELMLLPGLVDSPADEAAAIADLERQRVGLAVVGARDFSSYGFPTFGKDYDATLVSWLRSVAVKRVVVGDLRNPAGGTYPSHGFEVFALRPTVAGRLASPLTQP
jgi:hypothetical protein